MHKWCGTERLQRGRFPAPCPFKKRKRALHIRMTAEYTNHVDSYRAEREWLVTGWPTASHMNNVLQKRKKERGKQKGSRMKECETFFFPTKVGPLQRSALRTWTHDVSVWGALLRRVWVLRFKIERTEGRGQDSLTTPDRHFSYFLIFPRARTEFHSSTVHGKGFWCFKGFSCPCFSFCFFFLLQIAPSCSKDSKIRYWRRKKKEQQHDFSSTTYPAHIQLTSLKT